MNDVQIIPSILATSKDQYKKDLEKINGCKSLEEGWVHIDVTDNKFVQNQTITPEIVKESPTNLNIEVHLMVENPMDYFPALKEAGAKRIIAHVEIKVDVLKALIKECKDAGIEVGVAIKMDTPLTKLETFWGILDLILIMSVDPGLQGQPLLAGSIERVQEVSKIRSVYEPPFLIEVDGHIRPENILSMVEAGADNLVVGSFLLEGDIDENVEQIWEKLQNR